jgi:hypothetical protein
LKKKKIPQFLSSLFIRDYIGKSKMTFLLCL